ncbi:MAG: ABC transporter ATP-binding protein [Aeromonadaceae bacterium]
MIIASQIELLRGNNKLLDNASATIYPGHKVGLVGKNGCGKSSFFALLKGELGVDNGSLSLPASWQLAWVAQETPALDKPALEYVMDGDREYRALEAELATAEQAGDGLKVAELHGKLEAIGAYTIRARAGTLLHGLGFASEQHDNPVRAFSGGWRMRLNLAQALLCRSDLLLLDEPTNHLDLDAVIWLEGWLKGYRGTLILISHDRDFLDRVVGRIIHIENGKLNEYTGGYSDFELQRAEQLAQQQSMYEKQQVAMAHMQSYIDRFRYKASKARQAQSRLKAMERMEKILPAHVDSQFSFSFREPDALPTPLMVMENLSAGYGEKLILEKIKLNLVPGSRIGLLGRNGAGKSTFIKLLAGELAPRSGVLEPAKGVKIGYFAQHQLEYLRSDESPLAHLTRMAPDKTEQELRNFLGGFGFQGDKALEPVGPFSGGEKARLVLALVVWEKPNLLLLDEPTNHLDLEMREALTLALQGFEGAMVVVSHDRHLLRTTTDDLYLVHGGRVAAFDGDLDDYHKWLLELEKSQNNPESGTEAGSHSASARKDQKRREADFRQAIRPLKQQLEKLEKRMEKLQGELAEIEQALADPELYSEGAKATLTGLLAKQGPLKNQLEEVELEWMSVSETLEQKEQAFAAGS